MKKIALMTSVVVALAAGAALATVVVSETVETMARRAPLVVRVTARQSMAGWDAAEARIWTWTELAVTEVLKGEAGPTLLVKQPGGEVGGLGQFVAGVARFTPGEDCVLFLEPASDEKGVWVVRSLAAGKVSFGERLGRPVALRDLSGLSFAKPGGAVHPTDDRESLGAPDAFLARVRAAVGGAR